MLEQLIFRLKELTALSDSDESFIRSCFIKKKLRKKQYLHQAGDICKYSAFVTSGCLRAYTIDETGYEHISQFAVQGWAIADMYSFLTGEPGIYNIDAIEDSEVLLIGCKEREHLLDQIPYFEKVVRVSLENNHIATQRRINSLLSSLVEKRYSDFITTYPEIAQQVPQHMIASYIGVKPETLSRIRKKL